MPGIALWLPWPPSVNSYWRNVRGRTLLSARGREYREDVAATVLQQQEPAWPMPMEGKLSLSFQAYPSDRRRRDLDNLLKGPLDAMQHAGLYEDDSQIRKLLACMHDVDHEVGCGIYVVISPLGDA